MHVPFETLSEGWNAVLDDAGRLGCRYVVVPSIPDSLRTSIDDYRRVAESFTRGAEAAAKAGMGFAYHNHAVDFKPLDRKLPFDVLLEATDPSLVRIELDLYWIERAGYDPLRYFNRWPGTLQADTRQGYPGRAGPSHDGSRSGIIDWPNLLASARAAGAEHFFVEQDDAIQPSRQHRSEFLLS